MVQPRTIQLITEEMGRLAEELGDPIPPWTVIPGTTSFFFHEDQTIFFGQDFIEHLEAEEDIVDLVGLVAHEFWHWHQFLHGLHQDRPDTREANARRFAQQWATDRFPGREMELNFEDLSPVERNLPLEPGIKIDTQVIPVSELAQAFQLSPEDILFFEESFQPVGRPPPISSAKWLRFKLQRNGESYPYQLWRDFEGFMEKLRFPAPSYQAIRRLVWILNKLGLVRLVREEEAEFGIRRFYDVVPGRVQDPAWNNPVGALWG